MFTELIRFQEGKGRFDEKTADGDARGAAIICNYGEEKVSVMSAIS